MIMTTKKVADNKMDHVKSRQTSIKIRTSLNQDGDLCILPRNIKFSSVISLSLSDLKG